MMKHLPVNKRHFFFFFLQAFFDKDYITKHPGDAEKITQLKELMQEQVLFFKCRSPLLHCLDSSAVSLNIRSTGSFRSKDFWYRRSKYIQTKNKREVGKEIMTSHSPYGM